MRDGLAIIDADHHVVEPLSMWLDYLEPAFLDCAPRCGDRAPQEPLGARIARLGPLGLVPVPPMPMLEGKPLFHRMSERAWIAHAETGYERLGRLGPLDRPETHLAQMDAEGIDVACLFPTYALALLGMDVRPELARALARAYNAWLRDFCRAEPERLFGLALLAPHDPASMVAELDQAIADGFRAVVLRPNPVGGRTLGDPAFEPFWSACEQRGIAVALHEGAHAYLPAAGADRFQSRFALHACSHPMEQMMALLSLIEGGMLERHPRLRVAFIEAGCGWVPYWLWRLDEEYASLSCEVAEQVRRAPSAYFRRQCFVTMEPGEPYVPEVLRHAGEDNLLIGTDFPHFDHELDLMDRVLALSRRLAPGMLAKILWHNPARFFGIQPWRGA